MVSVGVYAILVTQTLNALASMVVLPTLPFYAMSLGANAFTISLMTSVYNLVQVFCSPALGVLSDKVGRKKVMIVGILCQLLCNTFMSYSFSVPRLLVARMSMGMAMSTGPVEMAYIMDFVDSEQELAYVLALQRFMTSGGALLGPIVVGIFAEYSFNSLCRLLVLINTLNLIVGVAFWRDVIPKEVVVSQGARGKEAQMDGEDSVDPPTPVMQLYRMTSARMLLLVSFLYTLGYGIGDGPEVVFFRDHFDFTKREACSFFTATNLACLIFAPLVPTIMEFWGPRTCCIFGCFGAAFSTYSLVFMRGIGWVPYAYGATMVGIYGTLVGLGFMQLVRKRVPKPLLGTMLGLQASINSAASTIAPPFGGAIYDLENFAPYILSSTFAAITGVMLFSLPPDFEDEEDEKRAMVEKVRWDRRRSVPRRTPLVRKSSTFGVPILNGKNFTLQVAVNEMRLELDPELTELYEQYRALHVDNQAGMRTVATVPGNMLEEQVAVATERDDHSTQTTFVRAESERWAPAT